MNASEIFFSLNGEGLLMGIPTVFVRLSGCNLKCEWCDTKYAWETGTEKTVREIVAEVEDQNNGFCSWVLITGGEPLTQDIGELVDTLKNEYKISIETNGSIYKGVLKKFDFISVDLKPPSSGNPTTNIETFKKIVNVIEEKSGQIKVVIADEEDYAFALAFAEKIKVTVPLILQPCWGRMTYKELCQLYFKTPFPSRNIRVLTQIHKIGDIK